MSCVVCAAVIRYADIIIPWQRGDNLVAIDLITQHIKSKLSCHELVRHYPNLEIMPSNFQVGFKLTCLNPAESKKQTLSASRRPRQLLRADGTHKWHLAHPGALNAC